MAIATKTAELLGTSLAIKHLYCGAINKLIEENKPSEFYEYIIDYRNNKNKLDSITKQEFTNLKEGTFLTREIMMDVYGVLDFIKEKLHSKIRIIAINSAHTRPGQNTIQLIKFMTLNCDDITLIRNEISKARLTHTDKSVLTQLTYTFKGWNNNNMYVIWSMGKHLYRDNKKIALKLRPHIIDTNNSNNNKNNIKNYNNYNRNADKSQQQPTQKPTEKNNNNDIKKVKISIYDRKQENKLVGFYYGRDGTRKISGTGIPYDDQFCPNYQIWSSCNLQFNGCTKKHVCSYSQCGSSTHGYAHCSKNPFCRKL